MSESEIFLPEFDDDLSCCSKALQKRTPTSRLRQIKSTALSTLAAPRGLLIGPARYGLVFITDVSNHNKTHFHAFILVFFILLMKNDRPLLRRSLTPGQVHFQILIYDDTLLISPARQICSVNNLPRFGGGAELPENVSDTSRKLICRQMRNYYDFFFPALV